MSLERYEQEFLERLGRFHDDAIAAARFTFLHLAFRYRSSRTPALAEKLNADRIFSRPALAARKGPEYASDAYEPTQADFSALNTELAQHAAVFNRTIGPLRDKAFAHSARISHDQIESLP